MMSRSTLVMAVLAVIALVALVAAKPIPVANKLIAMDEPSLQAAFGRFVIDFKRNYADEDEYNHRFAIFKSSMARANELNLRSETATFGITRFSDLSEDEREQFLGFNPSLNFDELGNRRVKDLLPATVGLSAFLSDETPPSFSFVSTMAPIFDQKACGSCWANSVADAYFDAAGKKGYKPTGRSSVQQLVDCVPEAYGCGGGTPEMVYNYLSDMAVKGLEPESTYPYLARTQRQCHYNATNVNTYFNYGRWILPQCHSADPSEDPDCSLQDGVLALNKVHTDGKIPSVCVYVSSAWWDYTSGIFDIECSHSAYALNHCLTLVAWNREESVVSLANSWGQWGDAGVIHLKVDFKDEDFANPCGVWNYISSVNLADPK